MTYVVPEKCVRAIEVLRNYCNEQPDCDKCFMCGPDGNCMNRLPCPDDFEVKEVYTYESY